MVSVNRLFTRIPRYGQTLVPRSVLRPFSTKDIHGTGSKISHPNLSWGIGEDKVAVCLFNKFSTNLEIGDIPVDPRGMKLPQFKKLLSGIGFASTELSQAQAFMPKVLEFWQKYYDDMVNGDISLPGREKAGPLTFAKQNDKERVDDLYDKHGRRLL